MAIEDYVRIKKRYTLPIWIIRMHLVVVLISVLTYFFPLVANTFDMPPMSNIYVFDALLGISLTLDILSIVYEACDKLSPKIFLILCTIQASLWVVNMIVDGVVIVSVSRGSAFVIAIVGIGLSGLLFCTAAILLVYAVIKFRRQRKVSRRGSYEKSPELDNGSFGSAAGNPYIRTV